MRQGEHFWCVTFEICWCLSMSMAKCCFWCVRSNYGQFMTWSTKDGRMSQHICQAECRWKIESLVRFIRSRLSEWPSDVVTIAEEVPAITHSSDNPTTKWKTQKQDSYSLWTNQLNNRRHFVELRFNNAAIVPHSLYNL